MESSQSAQPSKPAKKRANGVLGFLRHLQPPSIDPRSMEPTATFGLGLIALYLSAALLVTGVLLMVYYVPHASSAYGSIQDLHAVVPFGGLLRNIHRWAGHALVAVVGLHLLRTLLMGAYKGRRRGVWTAGVWLLVLTLAFAFTGYLLPWDQLSYWAVSIGGHLASNIPLVGDQARRAVLGGDEVSSATLVRFYALHVGILPMVATGVLVVHLFRLRRAGGLARPEAARKVDRLAAWPQLYERELALLVLVLTVLIVAGILFDAPLGPEPDPAHPEDPSKAPWYFLFLQELVSYSALLGGVLLPLAAIIVLYLVPFLDRDTAGAGEWLSPHPTRLAYGGGALLGLLCIAGSLAWHESGGSGTDGLLDPATALTGGALLAAGATWLLARRGGNLARVPARLMLLAVGGFGTVALIMLTVVGWLRGPSWSLVLPWVGG